jgi:hypothetical protein
MLPKEVTGPGMAVLLQILDFHFPSDLDGENLRSGDTDSDVRGITYRHGSRAPAEQASLHDSIHRVDPDVEPHSAVDLVPIDGLPFPGALSPARGSSDLGIAMRTFRVRMSNGSENRSHGEAFLRGMMPVMIIVAVRRAATHAHWYDRVIPTGAQFACATSRSRTHVHPRQRSL